VRFFFGQKPDLFYNDSVILRTLALEQKPLYKKG